MIPKTLLLSTVALSGVCYAGLLCSDANSLFPWITENFEKIKPLLDESSITTPDTYEEDEDVVYVVGSSTLQPRESSSPSPITPTEEPEILPKKEEQIKPEPSIEPAITIPPVTVNTKSQSPKPKSIPKPAKIGPKTLFTKSPKLSKRNPSNTPKRPRSRYIRGRGRAF